MCELAARCNEDSNSTYGLLNREEFAANNIEEVEVSMFDKTFNFSCISIGVREMASWLEPNRRPARKYHWNKKHGENGVGAQSQQKGNPVSILYCSREEAAKMLNKAVGVSGERRLFWYDVINHRYMVFMNEMDSYFHSFHVEDSCVVPVEVREKISQMM